MKDREHRRGVDQYLAQYLQLVAHDPKQAARQFNNEPHHRDAMQQLIRRIYAKDTALIKADKPWLARLFAAHLPSTAPGRIIALACGDGDELLHLRDRYPTPHLRAYEYTDDPDQLRMGIITSSLARAEFHYADLNRIRPNAVINEINQPTYVVCRHPGPIVEETSQFWLSTLPAWADAARRKNGIMLITTYNEAEMGEIDTAMKHMGIAPRIQEFAGGRDIFAEDPEMDALIALLRGGDMTERDLFEGSRPRHDAFVLTVSP